jgi:hypothetical protein
VPQPPTRTLSSILKRAYWSADDARVVLDALNAAGTPVAKFARDHGVDPQRLYALRRRLQRAPSPTHPVQFVELPPTAVSGAPACYEIVLPSGARLRIEGAVITHDVAALLSLLRTETAPC